MFLPNLFEHNAHSIPATTLPTPNFAEVDALASTFKPTNREFKAASPSEVKVIISSLPSRKSPGPDGIRNKILKRLPRIHLVALTNIINAMMRHHHFPAAWKEATVVCIPKKGKPLSSPSSFRPISLLCCLSKIAETVILNRISIFTESEKILPDFQHGFRKKHGSCHQLLRVTEFLADNLNKKHHTSMLLLDVEQAFDRVWHNGLIYKLIKLDFPHYLIAIIRSYLADRSFKVKVGQFFSLSQPISAGVPQGSKLAPLLFNIFCYDLPCPAKIKIAQYADDVALIHSSKLISHSSSGLTKALPTVLSWYYKWRLAINRTKCKAVFFSHRLVHPPPIQIGCQSIPWTNSAKYLGVVLDRKLTWRHHIDDTRNRILAAYHSLQPFFNNKVVSPRTKLRALRAIIFSISTYAIPIWGCADPKRIKQLHWRDSRATPT